MRCAAGRPLVTCAEDLPIARRYEEEKFFTRSGGRRVGTLLLLVLVIVEVTDLIFAVDSIPAIFAVTTNTFIVYTSNVFAILGLRSMYFLLAGVIERFHYLKLGLAIVLCDYGMARLGVCRAADCECVYVDVSRNAQRRFCSESCANRTNVAAFRARAKSTAATASLTS